MKVINVLAEPKRMLIVELLRKGPHSVGEIAEELGFNQPQASKHLKVLSEAGIVEVEAITNKRIYKLRPEPFQELSVWVESYLKIWEERYDNLDEYLKKMQLDEKRNKDDS
ncbi:TrmB family transcriptional regulator [Bacillus sp. LL01]|uniref:ArsR/SmtB family transcription factor n=1 Tax=Bacillus sp. LL01 TaxID=1665556 RepID=UPI00064D6D78|nr:metalloregulator ArsR/SmtB family transcription factor [Bacillus sp. LL01]KMJ59094.1 TrmB family transcriptional regulator [Bacillus sp. LL01]